MAWFIVFWVVILASLVMSIWSMVYARTAKREYKTAAALYERAAANYATAADTLGMVHKIRTDQEPPR